MSKISNTQVDNAKEIYVVMMFNSTEFSDNYSKTSEGLWQKCRVETALNNANDIIDFVANNSNNSVLFKLKEKLT